MPSTSYLISGTVTNSNGVNLGSAIITFSADATGTVVTNSIGQYVFDLANLGYTSGDTITYSAKDEFDNEIYSGSFTATGANKTLAIALSSRVVRNVVAGNRDTQVHNIGAKPISVDNPFPIKDTALPEDYEIEWVITRNDGQPESETVTLNGKVHKRTFTYSSDGMLTKRTKWVRQS